MPHDQRAQNIGAAGDLVVEDPLPRLDLVVAAPQLPEAGDRRIAGAVGVADCRPVGGLVVFPHREMVGDREGLAVPHHHPDDRVVGHPAGHQRVDPHPRQADLPAGAMLVVIGKLRQLLFMGAPAELGRHRALFAEAFHAPGVDKLIDLLRPLRDLRIPLAAVDHPHAKIAGQQVEGLRLHVVANPFGPLAGKPLFSKRCLRDVEQPLLREMTDEPRVGAVLDNRCRPPLRPPVTNLPQLHVAGVERELGGMRARRKIVGIPQLDGRVDVHHALAVAPVDHLAGVDIPGQIDEEIAGGEQRAEDAIEAVGGDAILHQPHALLEPGLQLRLGRVEVDDRDPAGRDRDMPEENREGAARDGAKPDEDDAMGKREHVCCNLPTEWMGVSPNGPTTIKAIGASRGEKKWLRRKADAAARSTGNAPGPTCRENRRETNRHGGRLLRPNTPGLRTQRAYQTASSAANRQRAIDTVQESIAVYWQRHFGGPADDLGFSQRCQR